MKFLAWNIFAAVVLIVAYFSFKPAPKLAPIVNAYAATPRPHINPAVMPKAISAATRSADYNVTEIKGDELALNHDPRSYAGKKVAITGMLWAMKSYEDYACGIGSSEYPCVLNGGPLNARCEYIVFVTGASAVNGCVPRSKLNFLALVHVGQQVTIIGQVDPKVTKGAYPWLRDSLILVFLPNGKIKTPNDPAPSEEWNDSK